MKGKWIAKGLMGVAVMLLCFGFQSSECHASLIGFEAEGIGAFEGGSKGRQKEERPEGSLGNMIVLETEIGTLSDSANERLENAKVKGDLELSSPEDKIFLISLPEIKFETDRQQPKGNLILSVDQNRNDWDICWTGEGSVGLNEENVLVDKVTGNPIIIGKNSDIKLALNSEIDGKEYPMFLEIYDGDGEANRFQVKDLEKLSKQSLSIMNSYSEQMELKGKMALLNVEWIDKNARTAILREEQKKLKENGYSEIATLLDRISQRKTNETAEKNTLDEILDLINNDPELKMKGILNPEKALKIKEPLLDIAYNDPAYTWKEFERRRLMAEEEQKERELGERIRQKNLERSFAIEAEKENKDDIKAPLPSSKPISKPSGGEKPPIEIVPPAETR